jgi:hypothetical protein
MDRRMMGWRSLIPCAEHNATQARATLGSARSPQRRGPGNSAALVEAEMHGDEQMRKTELGGSDFAAHALEVDTLAPGEIA